MSNEMTSLLRRQLSDIIANDSEQQQQQDNVIDDEALAQSNLAATILSNFFLFVLIFGLSATVSIDSLKQQLGNKFALLTGIAMQFVIMPVLGFLAVYLLTDDYGGFTQAMGVTLLVVTSSPGGSYSNWWCSLFNAELSLSVAMTAVSTMLSVAMLPANLLLYSHLAYGDSANGIVKALDFGTLFISLGIVMGGILMGLYCSYKIQSKRFAKWSNRAASLSGVALILVSVLLSSVGVETNFWNQHWKFYLGVAFPCLVGLTLANVFSRCCRLDKPECVAISIECCYQNTGIATSVAVTMFKDPEIRAQAIAVPLFYGLVEAALIGVYCLWAWKADWTKAPAKEKLCVVVSTTYEVEDGTDTTTDGSDVEAAAKKDDDDDFEENDDLPRIAEEGPKRWQFWKRPLERAEFSHVGRKNSKAAKELFQQQQQASSCAPRARLVSEDMTVATGVSGSGRSRLPSEDSGVLGTPSKNKTAP